MQPPKDDKNTHPIKPESTVGLIDTLDNLESIKLENTPPNNIDAVNSPVNSSVPPIPESANPPYEPIPSTDLAPDEQQDFTKFERAIFVAFLGAFISVLIFSFLAWFSGAGGIGALLIAVVLLVGLVALTTVIFVTNLLMMVRIKKNNHRIPIKRYFVCLAAISPLILWLIVSSLGAYQHNKQEQQKARNIPAILMPSSPQIQNLRYRELRVGLESSICDPYPLSFPDGSNCYQPLVIGMYENAPSSYGTSPYLETSLGFDLIQYQVPENYSIEENCALRRRVKPPVVDCEFVYETSRGNRVYTLNAGMQKAVVIDNILIVIDNVDNIDDNLLLNLLSNLEPKRTSEIFFHQSTILGRYYGNRINP